MTQASSSRTRKMCLTWQQSQKIADFELVERCIWAACKKPKRRRQCQRECKLINRCFLPCLTGPQLNIMFSVSKNWIDSMGTVIVICKRSVWIRFVLHDWHSLGILVIYFLLWLLNTQHENPKIVYTCLHITFNLRKVFWLIFSILSPDLSSELFLTCSGFSAVTTIAEVLRDEKFFVVSLQADTALW